MPASAAARATFTSGTAAPARSLDPSSILMSPKPLPQADHHPANAAVAHEQIGAEPDDGDGDLGRHVRHEISKVGLVRRAYRALAPGPPTRNQVRSARHHLRLQPPAQLRQVRGKLAGEAVVQRRMPSAAARADVAHGRPSWSASRCGNALIHSVMVPAPRPTTRSPGLRNASHGLGELAPRRRRSARAGDRGGAARARARRDRCRGSGPRPPNRPASRARCRRRRGRPRTR